MFMILAVPWAAAADDATGCDVAPTEAIVRGSEARSIIGVDGEEWRVLGRSVDTFAWVVMCRRGPESTADTVERQWLVERVGAEPPVAVSIGSRLDSSFEERFTGPVRVARSRRIPTSIPAWEVCGPWESGDTGDGARSKEGCRLVVSPVAARGVEPGEGQRVVTFIAAGEHPFMEFMAWFDTRSTWSAVAGGWRITETWTWRAAPVEGAAGAAGAGLPPLVEVRELRWDAAAVGFVVAMVGCENRGAAISLVQTGVSGCGVGVPG
jgi:hypothetical protein